MRKLAKRLTVMLMAAVLVGTAMGQAFASDSGDAVAREARKGVVRILMRYQGTLYTAQGQNAGTISGAGTGTGFGVGTVGKETDVFVTNRHVVTKENGVEAINGVNYYVEYTITGIYILLDSFAYNANTGELDGSRSVPCTVIYVGEAADADVAVIKAAEPIGGRVALPLLDDESTLQVTDKVSSLGYPGSSDVTGDGYKIAGIDDVTVQAGAVARISDNVAADINNTIQGRVIQHSATINAGNSGGPLIDQNGAVVGINTLTYHGGSDTVTNAFYAIRIKYAKDALDSLGLSYDLYKSKSGLPVIPIVAVVAVVAVAAVVVLSRKRPAAVKGAMAGAKKAQAGGGQPQTAQRAFIRSMAAQHNGLALVVGDTPIMIGRDPAVCKLVYIEGTAGVSGRHCSISYDKASGEFILTDLRSTYGTFLMNGQKLNANVPCRIKPGNGFYVGDKANAIRVELG